MSLREEPPYEGHVVAVLTIAALSGAITGSVFVVFALWALGLI